jgi:hypothetical protein
MYQKIGNIESSANNEEIILQNMDGNAYKVSFVVAFIWDNLNGERTTDEVTEMLCNAGNVPKDVATDVVNKSINSMLDIKLLETVAQA